MGTAHARYSNTRHFDRLANQLGFWSSLLVKVNSLPPDALLSHAALQDPADSYANFRRMSAKISRLKKTT